MLSATDVETAFRLILGRPPENEAVVRAHQGIRDTDTLRRVLLESAEFSAGYARLVNGAGNGAGAPDPDHPLAGRPDRLKGTMDAAPAEPRVYDDQGILLPTNAVETDPSEADRARLWARVAETWAALGREAPHWSVLTHERFRPDALDANRAEFELSGEVEGLLIDAAMARFPDLDPSALDCLEIGCGVGRATRALARRFRSVVGVDISAAHLEVAERECRAAGAANLSFRQVSALTDYDRLPRTGVLYSRIVFQHNPPPVQVAMLAALFGRLEAGGVALFQLITHAKAYRYSAAEDLARRPGEMEMHVLPQRIVFRLMAAHGLAPVEVQEDFAGGLDSPFRSHLFLARKGSES